MTDLPSIPESLVQLLRSASHVAILTGAGISAESGIPTFRDPRTGLWAAYQPEELATPAAFRQNPQLVWQWHAALREQMERAAPNPAHRAVAALEQLVPQVSLLTQNIDALHQRAGSTNVVELHGNIGRMKCAVVLQRELVYCCKTPYAGGCHAHRDGARPDPDAGRCGGSRGDAAALSRNLRGVLPA